MTKNRTLASLISNDTSKIKTVYTDSDSIVTSASLGVTAAAGTATYSSADTLPASADNGDQALVTSTNRLYIFTNGGWYNIALINSTPYWSSEASTTYDLSITGAATVITILAVDSEGVPITYTATTDSDFDSIATISKDSDNGRTFTVIPTDSENGTAIAGTGTVTFRASDGVNLVSTLSTFSITFNTANSNYTTLLLKADSDGTDNQVDASTNALTITEIDNVTSTAFSPYHPGGYSTLIGTADGTDFISVAQDTSLNGLFSGDFTIEFWFNKLSDRTYNYILSKGGASTREWGIAVQSNQVYVYWSTNGSNTGDTVRTFSATIDLNKWYHLAMTFDQSTSTITVYLDGTSLGTNTFTSIYGGNGTLYVGRFADYTNISHSCHAYITDLRVVKGSIVYSSAFTPPTEPLTAIANTSLLTCHLPYIADGSSNDHTVTVNGNTFTKRFRPYDYFSYNKADYGGSAYFDGTGDYLRTGRLLETNSTTFTIEGWVYYSAASISADIAAFFCDSNNLTGQVYGPSFGTNASQQLIFRWYNTPVSYTCTSSETVPYNIWTHIAAVVNSNSIQFYINGKAATMSGTTTYNGTNSTQTYATIGANDRGALTGYIADFRLTTSAVYTTDFTPPTAPLTAITNTELLTCTNKNDIWDGASGNVLTKAGNATSSNTQRKFATSYAVYLDGSGDYISVPTSEIFDLAGSIAWTIEGWFYWNDLSGEQTLVEKFTGGTGPGWTLYKLNTSNAIGFYSGSSGTFSNAIGTVTTGQWYHVAVTRDAAGTTRGFLNGSLNASGTYSIGNNSTGNLYIGARNGSANYMNGYVQDVRITKGLARYTAAFTPPTAEFDG